MVINVASQPPATAAGRARRSGVPGRGLSRRVFWMSLAGILLVQAAWVLVVPPFRGLDEHEHVFKAAGVARGDFAPHHRAAPVGWGEFMSVPADLVRAARPICEGLSYTNRYNCGPSDLPSGEVEVATSAARYNPAFYAVIGTVARPFHGTAAVYAMRAAAALMSALLLALALTVATTWARSRVVPAIMLVTATPVVFYSTAVAAPNGVEVGAAFLLWATLLGLARAPMGDRTQRSFVALAGVAAVPLAVVRTLGPLWLVLIVATCCILIPRPTLAALARDRFTRRVVVAASVLGLFGPAWSVVAGTNAVTAVGNHFTDPWSVIPGQVPLWFAQAVAAFPARDEMAPLAIYALVFVTMWMVAALALRFATWRERLVLVGVAVLSIAVPVAVTLQAYAQAGTLWQGRYGYPYAMGFLLICGMVLDRRAESRPALWLLLATGAVTVTIQVVGLLHVLAKELVHSPLAGTAAWATPPAALVVALVAAGTGLVVAAGLHAGRGAHEATLEPTAG